MKNKLSIGWLVVVSAFGAIALTGCDSGKPDVVTTPGNTTVIHDKEPSPAPNVTVNTPPSSSSTTNTTVTPPPTDGTGGSSTTTTTKTGG